VASVEHLEDSAEHEACDGEVVKGSKGLRESFILFGEPSEACGPGEAALDDPAARQQDEAAFGLCVLDHLPLNACGLAALAAASPV
jgi:hypothetical protein